MTDSGGDAKDTTYGLKGADVGLIYTSYHDALLASARLLIKDDHHQAAVMVAQMACESFTGQVIIALMDRRGLKDTNKWAEEYREGFSFLNKAIRALYFSVSGERIDVAFPHWKQHAANIELRNTVAHSAAKVTKEKAENVCDVAQALVSHLRAVRDRPQ